MSSTDFPSTQVQDFVNAAYDNDVIDRIVEFVKIPNQSPAYDQEWATNGLQEQAMDLIVEWVKAQNVENLTLDLHADEGRTPLLMMTLPAAGNPIEADNPDLPTVLMYGHMDKQPPLTNDWDDGLGPYSPVIKDGKLYGRGGADDGYSAFAAITAIKALQEQKVATSRIVIIIEACEESGSPDLPYYVDKLTDKIGNVELVVCLDSGAGNYEQLWITTSLRGIVAGNLRVSLLTEGVHSGHGSGIVADSTRVARMLLERVEDLQTGRCADFEVDIPEGRLEEAKVTAEIMGKDIYEEFPYTGNSQPVSTDVYELLLNRTWRPALTLTGTGGFPPLEQAGNVLRTESAFKLSLRVPPTADAKEMSAKLGEILENDPPYGAQVSWEGEKSGSGWNAPATADYLAEAIKTASNTFFDGKDPCYFGEGGSIPFMGMLGKKFPNAQFVITGVLGPNSNAHGPNEFLHIDFTKRLTMCVAYILSAFVAETSK